MLPFPVQLSLLTFIPFIPTTYVYVNLSLYNSTFSNESNKMKPNKNT